MPVGSMHKTRWEDQAKARYMLDPATGLPTVGASTPLETTLPGMEYLGGTSFSLDGSLSKWLSPSPGATTVRITANGGEVHYEINGVSASALSPGYVPDGQSETIGPICNMSAMWFFSATADTVVHVSYWRREGTVLAGAWVEPDYWQRVMALDPLAYWPLWETTGTVAHCLVNPAQNGTYLRDVSVMGTAAGVGDGNTAPAFNGAGDVVDIKSAALDAVFDANEITIACWMRPDSWTSGLNERVMRFYVDGNNETYIQKDGADNQVGSKHEGNNVADYQSVGGLASAEWYLQLLTVSLAADDVTLYIYQNGVLIGSDSDNGLDTWTGPTTATNTCIGAGTNDASNTPFGGALAHAMIFGSALPQVSRLALATV